MTSFSIISQFEHFRQHWRPFASAAAAPKRPDLQHLAQHPEQWPRLVRESPVALRYLRLLGPLAWDQFPERNLLQPKGFPAVPYRPFVAACLIKVDQHMVYMSQLRQYLVEHPALIWLLGFPLVASVKFAWGFDAEASLPTHRHFTRMLREMPNTVFQFVLDSSVALLQAELQAVGITLGEAISLDTKHILAYVQENNPKTYVKVSDRLDKTRQPKGDPDCKLGCKRKRNQPPLQEQSATPRRKTSRSTNLSANDEYFWGYASGVVATKVPDWGEFVLAELTLPFDQPDVAYFYPLLAQVERRLGFRPKFAAFDAAFDAFYIYEYFHSEEHDGFAAVPFTERGGYNRTFDAQGWPLCQAGLPMPLKYTFWSKTTLFEHERGRHVCPLLFPEKTGQACPITHKQWAKGGCTATLPTSIGARIRYQLDRQSDAYKQVYKQRTANERINSQAEALGIERPQLRNQPAIANYNTLIYVLINLRALQRIRKQKAERSSAA
jgi:hypothetical protein